MTGFRIRNIQRRSAARSSHLVCAALDCPQTRRAAWFTTNQGAEGGLQWIADCGVQIFVAVTATSLLRRTETH